MDRDAGEAALAPRRSLVGRRLTRDRLIVVSLARILEVEAVQKPVDHRGEQYTDHRDERDPLKSA